MTYLSFFSELEKTDSVSAQKFWAEGGLTNCPKHPQKEIWTFVVHFLMFGLLKLKLEKSQKRVHGKSLYSNCVAVPSLIFL